MEINIYNKLQRVTSNGEYFPEIDGLRFISILFVIICHLSNHFFEFSGYKNLNVENLLENGHNGVRIFFSISGYILMLNAIKKMDIRTYYFRRLFRIEPPYIISIIIIYIIIRHRNLFEDINHLIFSLLYLHSFIYKTPSIISSITWSLEVEVQFYLTFPLFYSIIKYFENKYKIGIIPIIFIIAFGLLYNYYYTPIYRTLLDNITYFYTGVLIAYLFKLKSVKILKLPTFLISICLIIVLFLLLFLNSVNSNIMLQIFYLLLICVLFNLIINYSSDIQIIFKSKFISLTGGMCYTIYLYHIIILLLFNKYIFNYLKNAPFKILLFYILYLLLTWISCAILYLMFEKPFMQKISFKKN